MTAAHQKIAVEIHGNVGILRLNDPAKLNAVTRLMIEEAANALDDLAHSVRAVIIAGAGRAFCSGAALDAPSDGPVFGRAERDFGLLLQTHINPLMTQLRNLPIPWISAVRGAAAGVGAALALSGDLVVASESAYFLQAFSRIALVPDGGATHLLVRTIGRVRAMELMMLADRLPARKAMEWGLVNRVVLDASLEEEALQLATTLASGPVVTLGMIRKAAWSALDADWDQTLRTEREMQLIAGRTVDSDEGIAAFNEKRRASFQGC